MIDWLIDESKFAFKEKPCLSWANFSYMLWSVAQPNPLCVHTHNSDKLLILFFYLGGHFISFKDPVLIILNSQERRCIMLASRQIFPVVTIKWKPLDDFLLVRNIVIKINLYSFYTSGFRFTHYTFSINIFNCNVFITDFFTF